ncbi:hypothetical protein HAX54_052197 [Datura stramonium]|uniref:GPI ethanolamine phosphate transferase 1 n=1 Tax=Datura stramonium TaxID=4076 RepID=A0ABS8SZB5_DATST|nr:hypothetical protein [Datura stramonium]
MAKQQREMVGGLGMVLHALYMLSIFDIYFKTPIVHGMDPVPPRFRAPAKCLVLLVVHRQLHPTSSAAEVVRGNHNAQMGKTLKFMPPTSRDGKLIVKIVEEDVNLQAKQWETSLIGYVVRANIARGIYSASDGNSQLRVLAAKSKETGEDHHLP